MTETCIAKAVVKLLNKTIEENGFPKSIKTDNATAFKPKDFQTYLAKHPSEHCLSTSYVHIPIGTVERNLQTLENHIKTYLIEKPDLRTAVKRATKVMRFTVSKSTGATPLEIHHGRRPPNILNNVLKLENEGRELLQNIFDLDVNHLAQNEYSADSIARQVFNGTYGKSASNADLVTEQMKRQVSPKIKYLVVNDRNRKNLDSRFHKEDIADVLCISRERFVTIRSTSLFHETQLANSLQKRTLRESTA